MLTSLFLDTKNSSVVQSMTVQQVWAHCYLHGNLPFLFVFFFTLGWACGAFVPVTAAPTVPIVLVNATAIPIVLVNATAVPTSAGPFVVAAYSQCNVAGAICAAGTGCFRNTALYSECRPACPPTWACQTDVAANGEQCGGISFEQKNLRFHL